VLPTPSKRSQSLSWQALAVIAATGLVAVLHWQNDGLWFQGDAPRHAASGMFFWDLLTMLPADPLRFALSYYARYPVIIPGAYPPLFYLLEGLAFWIVGPSAYVAKALVLVSAAMMGMYAMLWGRRWVGVHAGWAGACTVLLPGLIRYSNAVLLNVPAAALTFGALYHLRVWLDTARAGHRRAFVCLTAAAILTYYPSAVLLPIAFIWTLGSSRRSPALWLLPATLLLLVTATAIVLPGHLARQMPTVWRVFHTGNWTFYADGITRLTGVVWVVLGVCGLVFGILRRPWRSEAIRLASTCVIVLVCLVLLPAMSDRYALVLAPIVVLAGFVFITMCAAFAGRWRIAVAHVVTCITLALTTWSGVKTSVPAVSGFAEVARDLSTRGSTDSVLYSGIYDGVFGFYVRALDPQFDRRVVLSSKLLYRYEQRVDFVWTETPYATSAADVVSLLRRQSGCRWIAVEIGPESALGPSERLLRRALERPEFEYVHSFPVKAGWATRVDLYRFTEPLDPTPSADLVFGSFSGRVFQGVQPIASRR
jgi:uncharacterized membrane protein